MTPFEKLKLPANFEIVTAAEFLAALQPSRDIRRIGSRRVLFHLRPSAIAHRPNPSQKGGNPSAETLGKPAGEFWQRRGYEKYQTRKG